MAEEKKDVAAKAAEVKETLTAKVEEVKEQVAEVVAEVAEKVEEVKAEVAEKVEEAKDEVTEKVKEAKKAVKVVVEEVAEAIAEVTEEAAPEVVVSTEPVDYSKVEPLADFDWNAIGKTDDVYAADVFAKYEEEYVSTLTSIADHEVVDGRIVALTSKEAVVDINYKSEGIISVNELRYNADVKVEDVIKVYVENLEDKNGQLVISHKKARMLSAWDDVNEALATGKVIQGFVKCRTKGGLIVDVFGIEAFLPGSQIDVKPIRDYDIYVGKNMEFKVVKINNEFKNVVVSHKALIEAELEQQKVEIMSKLEKGQVLEGVVKNITSYGVFIDLGGVDGLIHITDLSWGRVNHPEDFVELDQKMNVVILDFDDNKKRIALGLKQLQKHPWESLDEKLAVGDKVKGNVVVMADYGAFVEIAPGVEGLIHVSEMSWSQHLRTAQDFFKVGDEVEAVVMTLDREERKMSLSTRSLSTDPWEDIESKYPVDSKPSGKVTNISNFGVFVELEEGIDGLIHISDLSWNKKVNHPSEFTKVGEEMSAVVLEIDKDNRRLSLGHKQLEENPWDVFESVFELGSSHKGTVTSVGEKGSVISLPYGIEGFCPTRHSKKESGAKLVNDDIEDFIVLEFNKEARKIIVSHTRTFEEDAREKADMDKKSKVQNRAKASRAVDSLNKKSEKSTLGDLDSLAALKASMEKDEKN
jgi:small subunit ribosomal protein S1